MNKKYYEKLLEQMESIYYNQDTSFSALKFFKKAIEDMYKLVEENYENKPLDIEELNIYFPYWDKEEKEWCYFTKLNKKQKSGVKISINEVPYMQAFKFEKKHIFL